jgi:hypothetical protein
MSIRRRVQKIIEVYTAQPVNNNYVTSSNFNQNNYNNLVGQIASITQDGSSISYNVVFTDGTTQSVSYGGVRLLGVGDGVIVAGGAIVG